MMLYLDVFGSCMDRNLKNMSSVDGLNLRQLPHPSHGLPDVGAIVARVALRILDEVHVLLGGKKLILQESGSKQ